MSLLFDNLEPFTTGVMHFQYRPVTADEAYPRIILNIQIGRSEYPAMVDTGGIFAICSPEFSRVLNIDPSDGVPQRIRWSRGDYQGSLHRLPLTFLADSGEDLTIDATAFIPQLSPNQEWPPEIHCILGYFGCLERLCLAIDPMNEEFHFGEPYPQYG